MKGIDYSPVYLERFFRNLLLGEQWDLRNRYLHIHTTKDWAVQPNLSATTTPISTPITTPSSISVINLKSNSKIYTKNKNIINLVRIIESEELSLKQMMGFKKLKDRKNFVEYHLKPALNEKFVRRKYPDRPNHPCQKYLLTVKGMALYNALMKEE